MRNRSTAWAIICLAATLVITVIWIVPVNAQTGGEEGSWQFTEAPYVVASSMDGTVALRGHELKVNASASDIFSNLEFGFMNYFEARKGDWGMGLDVIYMRLGQTTERPSANVDISETVVSMLAIRRLNKNVDLIFGGRVNSIQGEIEFKSLGGSLDQGKTWFDPAAGVRLSAPLGNRWKFTLPASFGGFGLGSKISIDAFPNVQVRLTSKMYFGFGWRLIYINYENNPDTILPVNGNSFGPDTDGFRYDVLTQGPTIGVVFRF